MIRTSEQTDKLMPALLAVQSEVKHIPEDAVNPFLKNRYASLGSLLDAVKPAANAHDIIITQGSAPYGEGGTEVTTRATHKSGQWSETSIVMYGDGTAQATGSLITYGRRYTTALLFALVTGEGEDDGEAAMATPRERTSAPAKRGRGDFEGLPTEKLVKIFFGKFFSLVDAGMPAGFAKSELTKKAVRDALIHRLTEKMDGGPRENLDALADDELRQCLVWMDKKADAITAWMRDGSWLDCVVDAGIRTKVEQKWNDALDAQRGAGGE